MSAHTEELAEVEADAVEDFEVLDIDDPSMLLSPCGPTSFW